MPYIKVVMTGGREEEQMSWYNPQSFMGQFRTSLWLSPLFSCRHNSHPSSRKTTTIKLSGQLQGWLHAGVNRRKRKKEEGSETMMNDGNGAKGTQNLTSLVSNMCKLNSNSYPSQCSWQHFCKVQIIVQFCLGVTRGEGSLKHEQNTE